MSIWRISPSSKKDGHPCSFPEEIPDRLIRAFSNEGDIVLDPFMGSGTTAKVSKKLNRNYIGFEISPEYCKIANDGLEECECVITDKVI